MVYLIMANSMPKFCSGHNALISYHSRLVVKKMMSCFTINDGSKDNINTKRTKTLSRYVINAFAIPV